MQSIDLWSTLAHNLANLSYDGLRYSWCDMTLYSLLSLLTIHQNVWLVRVFKFIEFLVKLTGLAEVIVILSFNLELFADLWLRLVDWSNIHLIPTIIVQIWAYWHSFNRVHINFWFSLLRYSLYKWPTVLDLFNWFHFRRMWLVEGSLLRDLGSCTIWNLRVVFLVNLWSWILIFMDLCSEVCLTERFWSHILKFISHIRQNFLWSIVIHSSKRSNMIVVDFSEIACHRVLPLR